MNKIAKIYNFIVDAVLVGTIGGVFGYYVVKIVQFIYYTLTNFFI